MSARLEYVLSLAAYTPYKKVKEGIVYRKPTSMDVEDLAQLFLDSYPGTIDFDGQSYNEALEEMKDVYSGRWGEPLLDHSFLALRDAQIVSACLMSLWPKRNAPLVCEMMTHKEYKGCGIGRSVLNKVLSSLQADTYESCVAFIKEGNKASESLFTSSGFQKV